MRVGDCAVGRDHERPRTLGDVAALRVAGESALPRRPDEACHQLRADVLLRASPFQPDRVIALALRIAEAVERNATLAAEVIGRIRAVLEDRALLVQDRGAYLPTRPR